MIEAPPTPAVPRRGRTSGFTLIEVIVALLLLELLLLGALTSMRLGVHRANRALVLEHAIWAAAAIADSIREDRGSGSTSWARSWGSIERVGQRIEASDSTGRVLVTLEVEP